MHATRCAAVSSRRSQRKPEPHDTAPEGRRGSVDERSRRGASPVGTEIVSRMRFPWTRIHRFGDQLTPSVIARSRCGRIVSARGPVDGGPAPALEKRTPSTRAANSSEPKPPSNSGRFGSSAPAVFFSPVTTHVPCTYQAEAVSGGRSYPRRSARAARWSCERARIAPRRDRGAIASRGRPAAACPAPQTPAGRTARAARWAREDPRCRSGRRSR